MTTATMTRDLWFLDTRVSVRVSHDEGADGLSVLESHAVFHDSPPLHVHRTEDELFVILDGDLRFQVGGAELRATAGETLLAPKNVPHSYCVESPAGARWLTVTTRGDFERFVRAVSRPAMSDGLPPRSGTPTPEAIATLAAAAETFGIELVGPRLA